MPTQRYAQNAPTHDWQQLRPLFKDPTQLTYEIIRPVTLGWETSPDARPQLALWPPQSVEWFIILKAAPYGPRPRHYRSGRVIMMHLPCCWKRCSHD